MRYVTCFCFVQWIPLCQRTLLSEIGELCFLPSPVTRIIGATNVIPLPWFLPKKMNHMQVFLDLIVIPPFQRCSLALCLRCFPDITISEVFTRTLFALFSWYHHFRGVHSHFVCAVFLISNILYKGAGKFVLCEKYLLLRTVFERMPGFNPWCCDRC